MGTQKSIFLDKLALRLEISAEYEEILENPLNYPINHLFARAKIRAFTLARIVHVDHHLEINKKF
jgi:hypothetical protein